MFGRQHLETHPAGGSRDGLTRSRGSLELGSSAADPARLRSALAQGGAVHLRDRMARRSLSPRPV